jgi:probable rRNA maturation factor
MIVSIIVEDQAWTSVGDLETLVEQLANAVSTAEASAEGKAVTIFFTDDSEITALNSTWRGKAAPTNVLSFPAPPDRRGPPGEPAFLGDVVLAYGTVNREAVDQGKDMRAHAAHLIVHGLMHLLGYDHETQSGATEMESRETHILGRLGFPDPYAADRMV